MRISPYRAPEGLYLATTGRQYHLFHNDTLKPLCWLISPQTADDVQVVRSVAGWRVCGWCKRKWEQQQIVSKLSEV